MTGMNRLRTGQMQGFIKGQARVHVLHHQINVAVPESAGFFFFVCFEIFFIKSILFFHPFQSSFPIILESPMLLLARKDSFLNENRIGLILGLIKQNKD